MIQLIEIDNGVYYKVDEIYGNITFDNYDAAEQFIIDQMNLQFNYKNNIDNKENVDGGVL